MRFRFCGDLDCPDWVLAEISILYKMTSLKLKQLTGQVVNHIVNGEIDYEKVDKLSGDAKFSDEDLKACIACLSFIVSSAAKNDCDSESLNDELQQLGLPKELSGAICKVYTEKREPIHAALAAKSLGFPSLDSVDWRIDGAETDSPAVRLCLGVRDPDSHRVQRHVISADADQFNLLLHELRQAQQVTTGFTSNVDQYK